jgi:predicted DCC family thiol-disulfide oxidoreductase YuxK
VTRIPALTSEASSAKPLGAMRILVGFVLLAQAQVLWAYRYTLLNPDGPLPWSMTDKWFDPLAPKISDVLPLLQALGLGAEAGVSLVLGVHALAAAFYLVGYRTRVSTAVAWATFILIRNSSMPFTYGLGGILLIALFYSLFMPVGRAWSVDNVLDTRTTAAPVDATWSVVVFRIHLCVVYAAAGFAKAMGADWWSGEAMWRALSLPQFRQFDPSPLASFPLLLQVGSIVAIVSQLLYPVLVWTRLRVAIVVLAELMHLAIAAFLGLWLFSLAMIAINTAAFGEAMWRALASRRARSDRASSPLSVRVIYDGACPFCDDYVRYQRLRAATDKLELVDARSRPEILAEHAISPAELEDGMVVVSNGRLLRGADAMHELALLSEPPAKPWVRAVAVVSQSRGLARAAYPFLKVGRRIALFFLGVPRFPNG